MTAPERIWARFTEDFGAVQIGQWADSIRIEPHGVEYIRADIASADLARVTVERDALLRVVSDNHTALQRAEAAEAKVAAYECKDGMDGAVVYAIREILNSEGVPKATFIDDHVANAIVQRDAEAAKVARLVEAVAALGKWCVENIPPDETMDRLLVDVGAALSDIKEAEE